MARHIKSGDQVMIISGADKGKVGRVLRIVSDKDRVVVEGMLARRPVIATGVGGVPEIVTDGTGVLVPPGDARALASALTRLLSDPVFAGEVACKGRLRATTHFTVEAMVDRKISHIEEAIRKQAA